MILQQYRHRLPIDHNMADIKDRVQARGPDWDDKKGLGFKAFSIQERGHHVAFENAYSSLYLWLDTQAATEFLWSDAFQNVCDSFGRPSYETWMVMDVRRGPSSNALFLYREDADVGLGNSLADLKVNEAAWVAEKTTDRDTVVATVGLDIAHWRRSRFLISASAPLPNDTRSIYQIAYMPKPGFDVLPG